MAVTVSSKALEATTMVVQSDLDVIVKSSRDEVFVFAENMLTGKPWPGVRLLVSNGHEVIGEGTTDAHGVFRKDYKDLPANTNFVPVETAIPANAPPSSVVPEIVPQPAPPAVQPAPSQPVPPPAPPTGNGPVPSAPPVERRPVVCCLHSHRLRPTHRRLLRRSRRTATRWRSPCACTPPAPRAALVPISADLTAVPVAYEVPTAATAPSSRRARTNRPTGREA